MGLSGIKNRARCKGLCGRVGEVWVDQKEKGWGGFYEWRYDLAELSFVARSANYASKAYGFILQRSEMVLKNDGILTEYESKLPK